MKAEKLDEQLGVCIKTLDKKVLHQNAICVQKCGQRMGQICKEGCMESYKKPENAFNEGMQNLNAVTTKHGHVDAVVINDGQHLTTLLYPADRRKEQQNKILKELGLTKSEIQIVFLIMSGLKNTDVAEKLFISPATLKTHLNNIYKKIPEDLKRTLASSR